LGTDIELGSEPGTENTGRGIAEKGIEVILEVVST